MIEDKNNLYKNGNGVYVEFENLTCVEKELNKNE